MDDDDDILDSPGYYQVSSSMMFGPANPRLLSLQYVYILRKGGRRWVIRTSDGLYIRKRWWGAIQSTVSAYDATCWKDAEEAVAWARTRRLLL